MNAPDRDSLIDARDSTTNLCGCGCGQGINPKVGLARSLRAEGLSFAQVGRSLNCSGAYVKVLLANPPRFVKGHGSRVDHGFANCACCGAKFLKRGENHIHCLNRTCDAARCDHNRQKWVALDREIEERRVLRVAAVQRRRTLRAVLSGQEPFGSESFRRDKLRQAEREIEALSVELQELRAEQEKELRFQYSGGSKWMLSLDAPFGEDGTLYDVLDNAISVAYQQQRGGSASDAWTDVVCEHVDRCREIDMWAAA